jgi:DNA repair exonuclease SbcCD ATPase subunit
MRDMDIDLDELIQELNDREPCEVDYYSLRLIEKSASALSQLKTQLEEARQAKQNVCSLLDQALEQNERLKAELEEARMLVHGLAEYVDYVPDDRDNATHINRGEMITKAKKMLGARYFDYDRALDRQQQGKEPHSW